MPTPLVELRKHRRFPVRFRIVLGPDGNEEEGVVYNLSAGGCGLQLARPFLSHIVLTLHIFTAHGYAITIDRAVSRWVKGTEMGLEFLVIADAQRQRLDAVIAGLEVQDGESTTLLSPPCT